MLFSQYNTYQERFIQGMENNPQILNKNIYALLNLLDDMDTILNPTEKVKIDKEKINNQISSTGLSSIEIRDNYLNAFPPEYWYSLATKELVIHGISAYRTFDQKLDDLRNILYYYLQTQMQKP